VKVAIPILCARFSRHPAS